MIQTPPTPQPKLDIDGEETLSTTLIDLLNTFPLADNHPVCFSTLEKTSGVGFFPLAGAAVTNEQRDIIGTVYQTCQYPFLLIYRAAPKTEDARLRIKEYLDMIGKWLEQQEITVSDEKHQIQNYPDLDGNRKIKSISRTTPAYLDKAYDDGTEDWCISITAIYTNTFQSMR